MLMPVGRAGADAAGMGMDTSTGICIRIRDASEAFTT